MEKLNTKEEVILKYLESRDELLDYISYNRLKNSKEVRDAVLELGDPEAAYAWARFIDHAPLKDTRAVACKSPEMAYAYAYNVDRVPRVDTREGACAEPNTAYLYAVGIDKLPTQITRESAYKHPDIKKRYEQWETRYHQGQRPLLRARKKIKLSQRKK